MRTKLGQLHYIYKLAIIVVSSIILCAVLAPWIAPYDPYQVSIDEILQHCSAKHWLGTDALGRDLLSRVIYGARTSVAFAVAVALCTMLVGVSLGIAGGYFGGITDRVIQCLVSMIQGLPGMSMMIAIAAVLPENDFRLIIAVTLTSWAGYQFISGSLIDTKPSSSMSFTGFILENPISA